MSDLVKQAVRFVSGDVHLLVTYEGDGLYSVSARAGHDEFSMSTTVPLAVFGPTNPLAYHKVARDVLQEAIALGRLPAAKARWMRDRTGGGERWLVLMPERTTKPML